MAKEGRPEERDHRLRLCIGNGLFTYVVNEGLVGQADAGADGSVSFEELSFHVARRVRELSSAQHVRMEPYVPILDQQMDFKLVDVKSLQQLFLRVSDISTFDNSALPGRAGWWQERIDQLHSDITLILIATRHIGFRCIIISITKLQLHQTVSKFA